MFYFNTQSCFINNGFSFAYFDVKRGLWQGDLLSPYLFIIALETLAIYVRGSNEIKSINVRDKHEIELTAFADDMTSFLNDDQSAENLLKVLNDFGLCSGLVVILVNLWGPPYGVGFPGILWAAPQMSGGGN